MALSIHHRVLPVPDPPSVPYSTAPTELPISSSGMAGHTTAWQFHRKSITTKASKLKDTENHQKRARESAEARKPAKELKIKLNKAESRLDHLKSHTTARRSVAAQILTHVAMFPDGICSLPAKIIQEDARFEHGFLKEEVCMHMAIKCPSGIQLVDDLVLQALNDAGRAHSSRTLEDWEGALNDERVEAWIRYSNEGLGTKNKNLLRSTDNEFGYETDDEGEWPDYDPSNWKTDYLMFQYVMEHRTIMASPCSARNHGLSIAREVVASLILSAQKRDAFASSFEDLVKMTPVEAGEAVMSLELSYVHKKRSGVAGNYAATHVGRGMVRVWHALHGGQGGGKAVNGVLNRCLKSPYASIPQVVESSKHMEMGRGAQNYNILGLSECDALVAVEEIGEFNKYPALFPGHLRLVIPKSLN